VLAAAEEAARNKDVWGVWLGPETNSLAAMSYSGLATGDQCIVIDSSLDMYFYKIWFYQLFGLTMILGSYSQQFQTPRHWKVALVRGIVLKNDWHQFKVFIACVYMKITQLVRIYYELISSFFNCCQLYFLSWKDGRVTALTLTSASTSVTVTIHKHCTTGTTTGLTSVTTGFLFQRYRKWSRFFKGLCCWW